MLTPKEAAARAGVSASLVYAWCNSGALKHYRLGRDGKRGCIRIEESEFRAFLQTMRVTAPPPADDGKLTYL